MNTKVLTPRALASRASSMLRSWSIFHWAARPPASARLVPRAEKTVLGVGEREASLVVHWVVSGSRMALSLGEVALVWRREMVWIVLNAGEAMRVVRMLEPTRPVEPMTAAVDILDDLGLVVG